MKTENKHQWIKIIAAVIVIFLLWGVKAGQSGEEKISEKDIQSEETEVKESVDLCKKEIYYEKKKRVL